MTIEEWLNNNELSINIFNKKYRYNNEILKSKKFNDAFTNMQHKPNILYRIAYTIKKYRFITIVDKFFILLRRKEK